MYYINHLNKNYQLILIYMRKCAINEIEYILVTLGINLLSNNLDSSIFTFMEKTVIKSKIRSIL